MDYVQASDDLDTRTIRIRTYRGTFHLENVSLETKRLLFGFDEKRHDCSVKAEEGDCTHWVPALS